jgi:hypothetical protein
MLNSIRTIALAGAFATAAMLPLNAAAQGLPNQDTFFTFSQAVELPGATLPAGTYLFRLADGATNRHIVRVMSEDRQKLHTTLLAIPNYSLEKASDEPQVRFMEGPETGPQAVKVWFYPGRTVGHEFIYPRAQALKIAQRTGETVLTTKTETAVAETVTDQDMTRVDRNGAEMAEVRIAEQPAAASMVAQEPTPAVAQDRAPMPAPERTTAVVAERQELPNTASFLPLLALIGVGSLIGNRWLRRSRRVQ